MRKILGTAIAATVLVVLFTSAQGTAALWRAEAQLEPGNLTTGTLSLAVGDGVTTEQSYDFAALDTSVLAPGGFVQAPLTISNTGTTALTYNLAGASSMTTASGEADTGYLHPGFFCWVDCSVPTLYISRSSGVTSARGEMLLGVVMRSRALGVGPGSVWVPS